VKALEFYKFQISMSRKGIPFDNVYVDNCLTTIKLEEGYFKEYRTIEDIQRRIPNFIDNAYIQKRHHSAIEYCHPNEYEFMLESTANPSWDTFISLH
jgi:hypothetical protein